MPRTSRIVAPGYPHHIMQRGNNQAPVFLDDEDRRRYLELIAEYSQQYSLDLWSYCLMDNHLHLLAVPQHERSLAKGIGLANQVYTQHFNRKYTQSGRVWQNRFFSCVVAPQHYLWAVVRFIVNNPLATGRCKKAEDYPWSSAKAHLLGIEDSLLSVSAWLDEQDVRGFRDFIKEQNSFIDDVIRRATSTGRPFGSDAFVSMLEEKLQVRIKARPVGRPRKHSAEQA